MLILLTELHSDIYHLSIILTIDKETLTIELLTSQNIKHFTHGRYKNRRPVTWFILNNACKNLYKKQYNTKTQQ